ncbi:winged helix-turn-helix domain-containing protein, partial [Streptococcus suis]
NRTVTRGDELINLTRREYDLLATLLNSPEPVSREQLLERVWKYEAASETTVVDVYIRYLRGKLDLPHQDAYIKTVR